MDERLKAHLRELAESNSFVPPKQVKALAKLGVKPSTWKDCGGAGVELKVYYRLGVDDYAGIYVRGTLPMRQWLTKHSIDP